VINIIFDLEATCWDGNPTNRQQEIIEIGAYKIDDFGEINDRFQQFVKPQIHPFLSNYCTLLTTIEQKTVDRAKTFPVVVENFISWIDDEEFMLMSWGILDFELLKQNSDIYKLDCTWLDKRHLDLKEQYRIIKNRTDKISFSKALEIEKIEFVGTPHRAIYDAANLVNLYIKLIDRWAA
jgi:inhibitor of KinA sporulation pathway (predicted exonuclease)